MDLDRFLKVADELGVEYEINSDDAGMFVELKDGTVTRVTLEQILGIE
ncbi:hypothetical protein [Paenibacillus ferrarius]|nr:hypothetical protein [Paenibacillus ferrarius]